tara:strand:+ start:236 stop:358 length:123 start_codon:yes stop_codon:yes gene_type:complete
MKTLILLKKVINVLLKNIILKGVIVVKAIANIVPMDIIQN